MRIIETKKVADPQEAIDILSRLNYMGTTFQHHGFDTRSDDRSEIYHDFDGYRNGELDGFSIIEVIANGKLVAVRFYNLFCGIIVELKLGDAKLDYNHFDLVIDANDIDAINPDDYAVTTDAQQIAIDAEIIAAQHAAGNFSISINGELVTFKNHSIVEINAACKLGILFTRDKYGKPLFFSGVKNIGSGNYLVHGSRRRIAASKIAELYAAKELSNQLQEKIVPFVKPYQSRPTGEFSVWVILTYPDGSEHHFRGEFDQFLLAKKFTADMKALVGDIPCQFITKTKDHSNDPKPVWVDPHVYEIVGSLDHVRSYHVIHIEDDFSRTLDKLNDHYKAASVAHKLASEEVERALNALQLAEQAEQVANDNRLHALQQISNLGHSKAKLLNVSLLSKDIFLAKGLLIINQRGDISNGVLSQIWISFNLADQKFHITGRWDTFAIYDKPAQVEIAIRLLKLAIKNGAAEFAFPTVVQLSQPPELQGAVDTPVTNDLPDSLARAMQFALENVQTACANHDFDTVKSELSLYQICANALPDACAG